MRSSGSRYNSSNQPKTTQSDGAFNSKYSQAAKYVPKKVHQQLVAVDDSDSSGSADIDVPYSDNSSESNVQPKSIVVASNGKRSPKKSVSFIDESEASNETLESVDESSDMSKILESLNNNLNAINNYGSKQSAVKAIKPKINGKSIKAPTLVIKEKPAFKSPPIVGNSAAIKNLPLSKVKHPTSINADHDLRDSGVQTDVEMYHKVNSKRVTMSKEIIKDTGKVYLETQISEISSDDALSKDTPQSGLKLKNLAKITNNNETKSFQREMFINSRINEIGQLVQEIKPYLNDAIVDVPFVKSPSDKSEYVYNAPNPTLEALQMQDANSPISSQTSRAGYNHKMREEQQSTSKQKPKGFVRIKENRPSTSKAVRIRDHKDEDNDDDCPCTDSTEERCPCEGPNSEFAQRVIEGDTYLIKKNDDDQSEGDEEVVIFPKYKRENVFQYYFPKLYDTFLKNDKKDVKIEEID